MPGAVSQTSPREARSAVTREICALSTPQSALSSVALRPSGASSSLSRQETCTLLSPKSRIYLSCTRWSALYARDTSPVNSLNFSVSFTSSQTSQIAAQLRAGTRSVPSFLQSEPARFPPGPAVCKYNTT